MYYLNNYFVRGIIALLAISVLQTTAYAASSCYKVNREEHKKSLFKSAKEWMIDNAKLSSSKQYWRSYPATNVELCFSGVKIADETVTGYMVMSLRSQAVQAAKSELSPEERLLKDVFGAEQDAQQEKSIVIPETTKDIVFRFTSSGQDEKRWIVQESATTPIEFVVACMADTCQDDKITQELETMDVVREIAQQRAQGIV